MMFRRKARHALHAIVAAAAAGMLFASSCALSDLEAIAVGVDAASRHLQGEGNDDTTFGEWLLEELNDLGN